MSFEVSSSLPVVVLPRSQVSIPVSPVPEVTDTVLFEDAQNLAQTYYLPRYRIATETVSGQQQFRLVLRKADQGGVLQVVLEKYPAPELATSVRTAQELAHTLDARIYYTVSVGNTGRVRKELAASEIETTPTGVRLTLMVADLNGLTQLYQAMTEAGYESALVIERQVHVALPVGNSALGQGSGIALSHPFSPQRMALASRLPMPTIASAPIGPRPVITKPPAVRPEPSLPNPVLQLAGVEEYEARGERFKRFQLRVSNWNAYPNALFEAAPDLPPCGANANASRTWVDILDADGRKVYGFCALRSAENLQQLWFAVPVGQKPPAGVSVALRDRRQNITYRSQIVSTHLDAEATHAIKLTVPTRNKGQDDSYTLTGTQLRNVNPGDTVTVLIEFPDQPMIPLVGATGDTQRTRIVATSSPEPASAHFVQPVAGQVETDADFAFTLDYIRLFGTPGGRTVAFEASVSTPPQEHAARVRSLAITFRVPHQIVGLPLATNLTIPIRAVGWQGLAVETEEFYVVGQESIIAQDPAPFVFDKALHGYIYRDILVDPGRRFGLIQYQERWGEHDHFYFQDEAQRDVVYYLPDLFKLVRKATPPYTPDLLLYFDTTDDGAQATLYYRAVPVVAAERLAAAEVKLRARLRDLPAGLSQLTFKPLLSAERLLYRLALPHSASALGPFQERSLAQVDLRNGIEDAVTLSMEDFRIVFDSLFTPGASMFNGRVEVTLDEVQLPGIPLVAKLYDLVGDVLVIENAGGTSSQQDVVFYNATESPIRINWLTARYLHGENMIDAPITNLSFPTQVEAGGDVRFSVVKPPPLGTGGSATAQTAGLIFNLAGVEVVPDPEGVWGAILDPIIRPEYRTEVKVRTTTELFGRHNAWAVLVEFPGRITVELTPERLETTVTLYVPIRDFILNRNVDASYRYRLQVVHDTHITAHDDWQTFRGTILAITDDRLPKGDADVTPSAA